MSKKILKKCNDDDNDDSSENNKNKEDKIYKYYINQHKELSQKMVPKL